MNNDIIKDISTLYELSLSFGKSLDLEENCDSFLKALMSKKNLEFTSVWIKNSHLTGISDTANVSLVYAKPEAKVSVRTLSFEHPLFHFTKEKGKIIKSDNKHYQDLITEKATEKGLFIIFPLGDIGILKLYTSIKTDTFNELEINKFSNVISKFTLSLNACIYHQKSIYEANERIKQEKQYSILFNNNPFPMFIYNIGTLKILHANATFLSIYNFTKKEVLQKTAKDFIPATSLPHKLVSQEELKSRISKTREWIHKLKNGSLRNVNITGRIIEFKGKKACIISIDDITERKKVQSQIVENERKYRSIYNSIIDAYAEIDYKTGNIIEISPSIEKISGHKPSELIGQNMQKYYAYPHERDLLLEGLFIEGKINDFEVSLVSKSGKAIPCSFSVKLIKNEKDNSARVVGTMRDISKRKATEMELSNESKMTALLMKLSSNFINSPLDKIDTSIDNALEELGKFVSADRVYIFEYDWCKKTTNNTYEWCSERTIPQINEIQGVPVEMIPQWIETHKQGKVMLIEDVMALDKDDELRKILEPQEIKSLITIPMMKNNKPVGFIGFDSVREQRIYTKKEETLLTVFAQMLVNIQIRQEHDKEIKSLNQRMKLATEVSEIGIWEWNIKTGETRFNEPWANIVGYTLKELSPVSINTWTDLVHQDDLEKTNAALEKHFNKEEDYYEIECRMKHKDGHWIWVADRGKVTERDSNGDPVWMYGTHKDITKSKQITEDLISAKHKAESASKAKAAFLSSMSHEIRTPLNVINGFLSLLNDTSLDDKQHDYISKISTTNKTLLTILNDILDFSKIESGKLVLEKALFDIHLLAKNLLITHQYKTDEKGLSMSVDIDSSINKILSGDKTRLNQILINLVSNAIKFTKKGSIHIKLKLIRETDNSQLVRFEVSDTGIGIDPQNINQIFTSFEQEDASTTKNYGGTGLGLAISKELVKEMGGKLEVDSVKSLGSRFYFSINLEKSNLKKINDETTAKVKSIGLNNIKVLVVEDNEFNLFITKEFLVSSKAIVESAENGKQAIDLLKSNNYDIILMDLQMPVMEGIEASKIIRQELKINTPIIALTANIVKGVIEECKNAGMNDYISKPFDRNALLKSIIKLLQIEGKEADTIQTDQKEVVKSENNLLYDISFMEKFFNNDKEKVNQMIEKFIQITPFYMNDINESFNKKDYDKLGKMAHKIKSSLNFITIEPIKENIRLIESYAKNEENLDQLPEMVFKLSSNYNDLLTQLKEYLKKELQ